MRKRRSSATRLWRSRSIGIGSLALLLLLVSSGCGAGSGTATSGEEDNQEISFRFDVTASGSVAPFVLAEERGWYAENDLDVSFGEGSGSDNTVKLIAQGRDDLGWADFGTMTVLNAEGAQVKSVAVIAQQSPVGIITVEKTGIQSPEDLEGQRVVMGSGDVGLWRAFAESAGIDASTVETVTVTEGSQAQMLMQGKVAAMVGWVTFQAAEVAELGGQVQTILYSDHGLNILNTSIVTSETMLKQQPEAVCSFVQASIRAYEYARDHPGEAVDALAKEFPNVDQSIAKRQLDAQLKLLHTNRTEGRGIGVVAKEDVAETQKILAAHGELDERQNPSELYTNRCVQ